LYENLGNWIVTLDLVNVREFVVERMKNKSIMSKKEIYFSYKEAPYFCSKRGIYLPIFIGAIILLSELIMNGTAYSLAIIIPLFLLYFYSILRYKENKDKLTEKRIVDKKLQSAVNEICKRKKTKVSWKDYIVSIPRQQYLPIKRSFFVGLSNGEVCRFNVTPADDFGLIIHTQGVIVEKDEDVDALIKKHKKIDPKSKLERIMANIAACIIIIGFAIIALCIWLGNNTEWMKTAVYILIGDFFLAFVLVNCLNKYNKRNRIIGIVYKFAFWNIQLLLSIIMLLFPSMLLLMGLLVIVIFPFSLIMMALKSLATVVSINSQTILFVSLTLGAIISGHYSGPLFGWLSQALTANGHKYEKYFQKLVEYVYKPTNIQFVVYFLYVVYLVVSTIYRFETDGADLIGNDKDFAVLESFLVFIAFSNMKSKRETANFRFAELFRIMYAMWTTHDNIEDSMKDGKE
jgi:hypothetical protein